METSPSPRIHRGPSLAALGIVYLALFVGGLILLRILSGASYPPPFAPESRIVDYFRSHAAAVRLQAFFLLGSAIPFGIYVATVVSRLQFHGVRVAGVTIALFGGFGASLLLALTGLVQWVLVRPEILGNASALRLAQDLTLMTGGPGYAVLFGLFLAGVSVPSLFTKLLPRWLCVFGLILAVLAELSSLSLIFFPAMFLVPLVRYLGFLWLIACGARLPDHTAR